MGDVSLEGAQGVIGRILEGASARRVFRDVAVGRLYITAGHTSLEEAGTLKYFDMDTFGSPYLAGARNSFVSKSRVARLGDDYFDLDSGQHFSLRGSATEDLFDEAYIIPELVEDSVGKRVIRNIGIPFVVDFGFQLAQDWSNPRLPLGYKVGRAGISGGVGVFGGGVTFVLVKGTCLLVGVSNPAGWMFIVGGVVVGVVLENPASRALNEWLLPEKPVNLRPLQ